MFAAEERSFEDKCERRPKFNLIELKTLKLSCWFFSAGVIFILTKQTGVIAP